MRLMATPDGVTGPVNIGNPGRVHDPANSPTMVIELTGSRSKIIHHPKPEDDPRQRRPDIALAKQVLDWSPREQLADGLKNTIAYFDEMLKDQGIRATLPTVTHSCSADWVDGGPAPAARTRVASLMRRRAARPSRAHCGPWT